MRALAGYVRLDGGRVDGAELDPVLRALPHRFSQPLQVGPGGAALVAAAAGLVSAAAASWVGPSDQDGVTRIASARLDNHDELNRELGRAAAANGCRADGWLVTESHRRWGEQAFPKIYGDWALAAWDPCARRLLVARDQYGHTALAYVLTPQYFAFAPTIGALLALPGVPRRLDELLVAQVLTSFPRDGVRTAYLDIRRLPPGHFLIVQDGRLSVTRYWHPDDAEPLALGSSDDYVEAFTETYRAAVRSRLPSEGLTAVTLSGGLDSGSVCTLAAPLVREAGGELVAFTSVPVAAPVTGPHQLGDEWPLASLTARAAGVTHVAVTAADASVVGAIEWALALHGEPGHAAANQYWIQALIGEARARDARVLLTGQLGNGTVSWAGTPSLWPWLRRGALGTALSVFGQFRRSLAPPSGIRAARTLIAGPAALPVTSARARARAWAEPRPWERYSAISAEAADRVRLREAMADAGHDPLFLARGSDRDRRLRLLGLGRTAVGALWHESSLAHGLDILDPTGDARVVEFCLRVPDEQWWLTGRRSLLRRAMRGRIPDEVLDARRKGLQAADIAHRVLAQQDEVRAALLRLERSAAASAMLDLRRMRAVLEEVVAGAAPATTAACGAILLRGIWAGLFLAQFD